MADTKEGMDLLEKNMEKAVEDLKVQIQDLQEGMQSSSVHTVSHEVPRSTAIYGKGKVPYTREDKGRPKQRESAPKLKCFLCDGPHLARECPKRKALSALIKKKEKTMEDARLGSIQMIDALQVMPKASPQGRERGRGAG